MEAGEGVRFAGRPRDRRRRRLAVGGAAAGMLVAFLGGCLAAGAPPADRVPPAPPPVPPAQAWTAAPDGPLARFPGDTVLIPRPFTRLEVVGADSQGIHVRCAACTPAAEGHLDTAFLVHDPLPPEVAAWGSLAEFALSVRHAAAHRQLDALRGVMADGFSFDFVGPQTPGSAIAVWEAEGFATLDRVPELLDGGIAPLDGRVWAAPPAFTEAPSYRDLRIGFRQRVDGRWEWVFLIGGIVR